MTRLHKTLIVDRADLTLRDCIAQIDANAQGFVFVVGENGAAVGMLTDGDIRRALLGGASLDEKATSLVNRSFRRIVSGTSREQILKLLDSRIRFLPVMDADDRIVDIITAADLEYLDRGDVTAKARAPARISLGGGGTDLTAFFTEHGGAVLNATINLYSRCWLQKRTSPSVLIRSNDYDLTIEAPDVESLTYDGKLDLVKAVIKLLKPPFGFELEIASDFPPSSGLGGSSVVLAAVIGCFNQLRDDQLDGYDVAELAFQAERIELAHSGGWQDQYASVFGGFNFMEFRSDRNEINSLKLSEGVINELEDRLLLCYSGQPHPTRKIHDVQRDRMVNETRIVEFAKRMRDVAYEMKSVLLRGQLDRLGALIHEAWTLKKTFAPGISDATLDEMYDFARANGAAGGKLLGAGGGGFFFFFSERRQRHALAKALKGRGFDVRDVHFVSHGLQSWVVRN